MNKRLTSLLLTVVMLLSLLVTAVPASAAPTNNNGLSLSKTTASPGEEFEVYLVIPPITAGKTAYNEFKIHYDCTKVLLTEFTPSMVPGTVSMLYSTPDEANNFGKNMVDYGFSPDCGQVGVNYMSEGSDNTADWSAGMTYTCKFKVADDAALGDTLFKIYTYTLSGLEEDGYTEIDYTPAGVVMEANLKIVAAPKPATNITIKSATTLTVGSSEKLIANVTPSDTTDTVSWTSSKPSVATVDSEGNVNAIAVGTATITAKAGDKTATCTVTVEAAPCTHSSKSPVSAKESTCKERGWNEYQKCDDCDKIFDMAGNIIDSIPYLDYAAHNYTAETIKDAALKTPGTCKDKAVYYKSCSVCQRVDTDATNVFYGEKNPDNHVGGYSLINQKEPNHKEQIKGYTGDKKCLGCNEIIEYGHDIAPGDHAPSVWTGDDTHHWKTCTETNCGVLIDGTKAEHTSTGDNVATCEHKAVCDICHREYGEKAEHSYSASWSSDGTNHWHACTVCGEKDATSVSGHVFNQRKTTDEYKASDATCTEKATYYMSCECGAKGTEVFEYGTPKGHTASEEWASDEANHWHVCADCGIVLEDTKFAHRPDRDEPTVNDAVKCSVCDRELIPPIEIVNVEIPITLTVKQGGTAAPGKQEFEFEICEIGMSDETLYPDVTYTAKVETDGKGDYTANLVINGPENQVNAFVAEGFFVKEKDTKAENWTYSDKIWFVMPLYGDEGGFEYVIYPATSEKDGDQEYYQFTEIENPPETMVFENTYTADKAEGPKNDNGSETKADETKPDSQTKSADSTSPKTFDSSNLILLIALLFVSGGAVAGTAVYVRKVKGVK